jgi:outer membrane protein assembly factor BamB
VPPGSTRFDGLRIREGEVRVSAGLSRDVVQRIVRQNFGRFKLCYVNAFRREPMLPAQVTVRVQVAATGAVASADVQSAAGPASVAQCVARGFVNVSFPEPKRAAVAITYPLSFAPPPDAPPPDPPVRIGVPGAPQWAARIGSQPAARVDDVAVDADGRMVVAGVLTAPATFAAIQLAPSAASVSGFVLRLDERARPITGGLVDDLTTADARLLVAIGPGDHVLVAGPAATGRDPEYRLSSGQSFVASVRSDGSVAWSRRIPVQAVTGLAIGADGASVAVGLFKEASSRVSSRILRWSPDGALSWQKDLGEEAGPGSRRPALARGVAIDREGAAVVVGTVDPWDHGHLDLGLGIVNARGEAGFIAKLMPDGRAVWSRGTLRAEPYAVAVGADRVLVSGTLECVRDEGHGFVLAMDAHTGALSWAWRMPAWSWRVSRVAMAPGGESAFLSWNSNATIGAIDSDGRAKWTRRLWADEVPLEGLPALAESELGPVLLLQGRDMLRDLPDDVGSVADAGGVLVGLAK